MSQCLHLGGCNSVVAVHGVNGDRENTWTIDARPRDKKYNWLEQIHDRSPGSRIMTFGYQASTSGDDIIDMSHITALASQMLRDLVKHRHQLNLAPVRSTIRLS